MTDPSLLMKYQYVKDAAGVQSYAERNLRVPALKYNTTDMTVQVSSNNWNIGVDNFVYHDLADVGISRNNGLYMYRLIVRR